MILNLFSIVTFQPLHGGLVSLSDNKIVPDPLPFAQSAGCRKASIGGAALQVVVVYLEVRCLSFLTGCFFFGLVLIWPLERIFPSRCGWYLLAETFFAPKCGDLDPKKWPKNESPSSLTVIADSTQGLSHAIPPGEQGNLTMLHTGDERNPANQLVR